MKIRAKMIDDAKIAAVFDRRARRLSRRAERMYEDAVAARLARLERLLDAEASLSPDGERRVIQTIERSSPPQRRRREAMILAAPDDRLSRREDA